MDTLVAKSGNSFRCPLVAIGLPEALVKIADDVEVGSRDRVFEGVDRQFVSTVGMGIRQDHDIKTFAAACQFRGCSFAHHIARIARAQPIVRPGVAKDVFFVLFVWELVDLQHGNARFCQRA